MPPPSRDDIPLAMTRDPSIHRQGSPAILILVALCALLGASPSIATGATIGVVVLAAVTLSSLIFLTLRGLLSSALQPTAFIVSFSGCVTAMDLLLRAGWPALHRELGIFPSLTIAAGPLLASADLFSAGQSKAKLLREIGVAGLVFVCAATLLGALRQFAGRGVGEDNGYLLALLPPGALIAMGLLIAVWNWIAARAQRP